jgi:hypothetical protein
VGVTVGRFALHALLHRAQVEEQLALGLGRGDLDHAPVLQDVFVDLGLDPVHRIADQAHALLGVEALDGLHQADVAFLDQVALRQPVAQVLARDRHHQAQVRQHQLPGGLDVAVVAQAAASDVSSALVSIGSRFTAVMYASRLPSEGTTPQGLLTDRAVTGCGSWHLGSGVDSEVPTILALDELRVLTAAMTLG